MMSSENSILSFIFFLSLHENLEEKMKDLINMRDLLGAAIIFIALAVSTMIGGAMISVTQNVTQGLVSNTSSGYTLIGTLATSTGNALTTLTSLLPIVALALVGGVALYYVVGFLGGGAGKGGNV